MRAEPLPDPAPAGVVVAREAEIHAGSVGSPSRFTHPGGGGGVGRLSTVGGCRFVGLSACRTVGLSETAGGAVRVEGELKGCGRMTDWNYGDVWETVADVQPESVAVTQGARNLTWAEFDAGADGVAQFLLDLGVARQDKVAVYLYNCPEYIQATFAAVKIGLVPVNTNYRYGDDELSYLWENADAVAVVFHGAFTARIEGMLERVPGVKGWLWVDDGTGPCPDWATPYEDAAKSAIGRVHAPWRRSGDDLYMLYTGGTTGMPKGVMWRQDDLFARLIDGGVRHYDVNGGVEGVRAALEAGPSGVTLMPACPLMHGTGAFTANTILAEGGRVCLLDSRKYDPVEMLDAIQREKVNGLVIVGDPFSRPLLAVLDEHPGQWDLSSLAMIISSGAMWSEPVKQRLLAHHPGMLLVDAFSSSEALGMGVSVSGGGAAAKTASFTLGPDVKVLTEDGKPVAPGSDEVGVLALGGRNPLGYYKDEDKSDRTFKEIDGVRYSIPGDFAAGRRRRHHPPARPGLGLHQLRRREDLPRRGRGGPQDPRRRARRRRGGRSRIRPTASRSSRSWSPPPAWRCRPRPS